MKSERWLTARGESGFGLGLVWVRLVGGFVGGVGDVGEVGQIGGDAATSRQRVWLRKPL